MGSTTPDLEGVIGLSFYWKQLSAGINCRYQLGGQIFASALYNKVENLSEQQLYYNVDRRALYDRWQKPGDVTTMKDIRDRNVTTGSTSRFVQKDNTLQFNSITLSYDFDTALLRKAHIGMCRLSLVANDIFYLSSIRRERGLSYPFSRTFSFSMNISF